MQSFTLHEITESKVSLAIRQKSIGSYYHHSFNSEFGRKRLQHICLQEWETIPLAQKECSFSRFKNNYKAVLFEHYSKNLV